MQKEEDFGNQVDMSDDLKSTQKITGYLEKRGKLKLMNSWKRQWFVLEGHLLLYYGSKEEYDALSPCKGSITLGPTCSVKPYPSTPAKFQITTRSGCVITLRAESISEQNKWMQAICSSVKENQKVDISPTKLCHFRYSTERIDMLMNNSEQQKRNTSPLPEGAVLTPRTAEREEGNLLERLQRMGARSYCESIVTNQQKIVKKTPKPEKLDLERNANEPSIKNTVETGVITPKKLQFSPKISRINEEPTGSKGEEIIIEDEDYCVCTLEKNEDPKKSEKSQKPELRSISFSEAREVFNRSQNSSLTSDTGKGKRKSDCSTQDTNFEMLAGKIQKSSDSPEKRECEDEPNTILHKGDREEELEEIGHHQETKLHVRKSSSDPIEKMTNVLEESNTPSENQESLRHIEVEKHPSQISMLGAYYSSENVSNEHEKLHSYQDFRENELYAKTLEPKTDKFQSISEEDQARKLNPEFQFPPPPKEAYESIQDLTANINYEDDQDSLYEEAEDFVWQNEIYQPTLSQHQSDQYSEPIFHNKPRMNNAGLYKYHRLEKDSEIDDDLYEEVDKDFTFQRSPIDQAGQEKKSQTSSYFHDDSLVDTLEPNMYEEVTQQYQTKTENHDETGEAQVENALYSEVSRDSLVNSSNSQSKRKKEKQIDVHQSKEEYQKENELYAEPNQIFNKDNCSTNDKKELQIDNVIYAESTAKKNDNHVIFENDLYAESEKTTPFSRQNSRTEKEVLKRTDMNKHSDLSKSHESKLFDNMNAMNQIVHSQANQRSPKDKEVQINNDLYSTVSLENEIYAEPNLNLRSEEDCTSRLYDEPHLEGVPRKLSTRDDAGMNVYEDPDKLMIRPQKTEEKVTKKKKLQKSKSEEMKKQDNFIQRLLKQATRKHGEKSDKGSDFSTDNADETLALLADIQVLLEKKKKFIKEMVTQSPKSNHRRILSETSAQLASRDSRGTSSLSRTQSIDLNDEYSTVRDSLDDDNEVIYSEVEMIDRSSKELKDLIQDLLKHNRNSRQDVCDTASCTG